MLLAIDCGNTQTVFGLFDGAELIPAQKIPGNGTVSEALAGLQSES